MFVGAERLRQFTELNRWWDQACTENLMRIVVVRGPARSGKTELLRRLYGHCALAQTYWPHEPAETDSLYPSEFTLSRDTRIPYL